MPGIAAVLGAGSAQANAADARRMLQLMEHETFYVASRFEDEALRVWAGALNHEGSFADCMPLWNSRRSVCLLFCGEDIRDPAEVRAMSRSLPPRQEGKGAEYLLELYERQGLQFLQLLNGWFSGVLVDLERRRVVLFNDRYGLGRLYVHEAGGRFCFASEAKCLLALFPATRSLNVESLAEQFSCGAVLGNKTLFHGISMVPAGAAWCFEDGQLTRRSYFDRQSWERQQRLAPEEFYAALKDTVSRTVPRYIDGSSKLGMSLTGGLDGRIVLAWSAPRPGSLPCYTFAGMYRDSADVRIARRVATLFGQTHTSIVADEQLLAEFPALSARSVYLSDGTMDVTGGVELFMNRRARQIAPVRLTGSYGSEILRGNVAFKPQAHAAGMLDPVFEGLVRQAAGAYAALRREAALSFIAFGQVPWHHYPRFSIELSQVSLRLPYLDNELVALMYRAPPECVNSVEPSLRLIAEGRREAADIPTDRGLLGSDGRVKRFLRRLPAEVTFKADYAWDLGMPHAAARIEAALRALHLERLLLGRHKFYHFRIWYRDRLHGFVRDILLDPRSQSRSYYRRGALKVMVEDHLAGRRNYTAEIHLALSTELLHRLLLEAPTLVAPDRARRGSEG